MYIRLNENQDRFLGEILQELANLQLEDGSFKYSTFEKNSGPYQTLEALVPFLMTPSGIQYNPVIRKGLDYVLEGQEEDGGFRPFPEFRYWDHSAVDSSALALYVMCLARSYPSIVADINAQFGTSKLPLRLTTLITRTIKYLADQKNDDGGWGIVKHPGLSSRTYSTSLVVNGLSHCTPNDFEHADTDGLELIRLGVNFLLGSQDNETKGSQKGGWAWSLENPSISTNITAVVIWSLVSSLRYNRDIDTLRAIDLGVKFINRVDVFEDQTEEIHMPISSGRQNMEFRNEEFVHDYYHVIPAVLMSGELGYNNDKVIRLMKMVEKSFQDKLAAHHNKPRDPKSALLSWDLAAHAFALASVYAVPSLLENTALIYSYPDSASSRIIFVKGKAEIG